ncbi:ParB/RepB/Spo0J family partition protein [Nocardia aurantia]|uniref:Transcriptional regulator NovG n=1 Tax=Nocardia aurantia TaxID=2585199 RepID=A0A7K0DRM8_9NOCA|nr:ParB N-terminal domain-containing protein [Nocardia aurantia]MQY27474.1 Transcriptional regulator NovG [Nocardia aurantia]
MLIIESESRVVVGPEAGRTATASQSVTVATRSGIESVPIGALLPADSPRSVEIDESHVHRLMSAGDLPPIIVHRATMRVIDGAHRVRAAALAGRTHIDVRYFEGTEAAAFVLAVRSNTGHGLQLSHRDRVAAARRIMRAFPVWSNRSVAVVTALSAKTVANIRRTSADIPQSNTRVGLDGRTRPVDSTGGRRRAAAYLEAHPRASLREIASAAGISIGTARDVRNRAGAAREAVLLVPEPPVVARPAEPLTLLHRDPALRHSETGRLLLRLLDNRMVLAGQGEQIIAQLPAHTLPIVTAAVRQCIETWQAFVDEVDPAARDALRAS